MDLSYRYTHTEPFQPDGSRLALNLNNKFFQDYALPPKNTAGWHLLHIPLIQGMMDKSRELLIPALRLGVVNQLHIEMLSLRAWANAGFPFSRYADCRGP